jgi:phage recombination protein Bet
MSTLPTTELSPALPQAVNLTPDHIKTLEGAGVIPAGCPPDQVAVFAEVCRTQNLSPFLKQIYLVGYGGKYSVITGIDGYRACADRSGTHAGTDEAKYNLTSDGRYLSASECAAKHKVPVTATVTVYKIVGGVRVPYTHTAVFAEFSTGKQKWATMPFQMIAKVAESHALRKAFPVELAGLRTEEELGAIQGTVEPEYRERSPAEIELDECQEAIRTTLAAMDGDDKKAVGTALKARWADTAWREPILAKYRGGEMDEKFLVNYCTDEDGVLESDAEDKD